MARSVTVSDLSDGLQTLRGYLERSQGYGDLAALDELIAHAEEQEERLATWRLTVKHINDLDSWPDIQDPSDRWLIRLLIGDRESDDLDELEACSD